MPATILAIDTATEFCSVALAIGERLIERRDEVGQRHSEFLLPMVDAVLGEARLELTGCDAVAFGAGPGSFTGLRIACAVAQGLAVGSGRPVIGIGNLTALAMVAAQARAVRVLAAIDARMNEIYWAVYETGADAPKELAAPSLASVASLAQLCERYRPDRVAGNALRLPAAGVLAGVETAPEANASAATIAALAQREFAAGRAVPAALAAPVYVRDRVALSIDERRAGASL